MSTISINLPAPVLSAVLERAKNDGYADVGDFVASLLTRISQRQTEVEQLAVDGIQSGPSEPWRNGDLNAIRNQLSQKYGS